MNKRNPAIQIPDEVLTYQAILYGSGGMVGLGTYNRMKDIENRYPEWFPWETKYKSIPQEVHDAYLDEKYPNRHKPLHWQSEYTGIGILKAMERHQGNRPFKMPETQKEFSDMWAEIISKEQQMREQEKEKYEVEKKLWDKHYRKYKLEYRG